MRAQILPICIRGFARPIKQSHCHVGIEWKPKVSTQFIWSGRDLMYKERN